MFFVTHTIINIFILYVGKYSSYASSSSQKLHVGTVLFTPVDNIRTCWGSEAVALLNSRYIFENVLPDQSLITIKNSSVVNDVVGYFRLVLNLARESSTGTTRHLLTLALSDAIGGYLHRFVLPLARYAYYNGYIQYDSMEKLYNLFGNIKDILKTSGKGWTEIKYSDYPSYGAKPLSMLEANGSNSSYNACNKFSSILVLNPSGTVIIPLPYTDSIEDPVSIALPLKTHSLVSLTSKRSKNILVKYYILSIECLKLLNATDANIKDFNLKFMHWLDTHVSPHLYKNTFYAGFGGVLQIIEAIKTNRVYQKKTNYSKINTEETPTKKKTSLEKVLIAVAFVWVFLGFVFICQRMQSEKGQKHYYV